MLESKDPVDSDRRHEVRLENLMFLDEISTIPHSFIP